MSAKIISFTIPLKTLREIVSFANKISPKNSEIEMFTCLQLSFFASGLLQFLATDGQSYYLDELYGLPCEMDACISVKTDLFHSLLSLLPEQEILLEFDLKKQACLISGQNVKHQFRFENLDEKNSLFEFPEDEFESNLVLPGEDFQKFSKMGLLVAGKPKSSPQSELWNLCLNIGKEEKTEEKLEEKSENVSAETADDKKTGNIHFLNHFDIEIAATDRFRIFIGRFVNPNQEKHEQLFNSPRKQFLLPAKSVALVNQIFVESAVSDHINLKLSESLAIWQIFDENEAGEDKTTPKNNKLRYAKLATRLADGKFPDYRKIIPQTFACRFEIDKQEILKAITQVEFVANTNQINKGVSIELLPSKKEMKLIATTDSGTFSETSIAILDYAGVEENWQQNFNLQYLSNYIKNMDGDVIVWEANPGKPSILSPKDRKWEQLYLVSGLMK